MRGFVNFIRADGEISYPSDPDTKKKVTLVSPGIWTSPSTDRQLRDEEVVHRYIMSLKLADHTGSQWMTAFDESGGVVLGKTAGEMRDLKENDRSMYDSVIDDAKFKPLLVKVQVREDESCADLRKKKTLAEMGTLSVFTKERTDAAIEMPDGKMEGERLRNAVRRDASPGDGGRDGDGGEVVVGSFLDAVDEGIFGEDAADAEGDSLAEQGLRVCDERRLVAVVSDLLEFPEGVSGPGGVGSEARDDADESGDFFDAVFDLADLGLDLGRQRGAHGLEARRRARRRGSNPAPAPPRGDPRCARH